MEKCWSPVVSQPRDPKNLELRVPMNCPARHFLWSGCSLSSGWSSVYFYLLVPGQKHSDRVESQVGMILMGGCCILIITPWLNGINGVNAITSHNFSLPSRSKCRDTPFTSSVNACKLTPEKAFPWPRHQQNLRSCLTNKTHEEINSSAAVVA